MSEASKHNEVRFVVLAGGTGTRLWPLSRKGYPKQFIDLIDDGSSLFQQTVKRGYSTLAESGVKVLPPIVVCNEENRFMVAEQLREIGVEPETIILEPVGRNTAPAVALAAEYLVSKSLQEPMLILPSDHLIRGEDAFKETVLSGLALASKGRVVTFGVNPTRPETGYGYIKRGSSLEVGFDVDQFVEKPDAETAMDYLHSEDYFWNSGMFLVMPSVYQDQLRMHADDIYESVSQAFIGFTQDMDFVRVNAEAFSGCRSESIDYAIMENTLEAALVPLDAYWSDVGAWSAVAESMLQDEHGNALSGDVESVDTKNCLVRADSRLVATVGVENLVVVETADAVLVADKSRSQAVKTLVSGLAARDRTEVEKHTRVYRPWGWYETICLSDRFQVKRIMVKPGQQLSLQMHHHRAEHWVVVTGTAKIVRDDEIIMLTEDQSSYIPLGTKHRLENPGVIPLHLIEIQTGSYLGEDDIVRFEDQYGRTQS